MNHAGAVIATVCSCRGVAVREVFSGTRIQQVAHARQEAQHILREVTGKSLSEISRIFGRDQKTVSYGLDVVAHRMKDDIYRAEIAHMQREAIAKIGFASARPDKAGFFRTSRKSAK